MWLVKNHSYWHGLHHDTHSSTFTSRCLFFSRYSFFHLLQIFPPSFYFFLSISLSHNIVSYIVYIILLLAVHSFLCILWFLKLNGLLFPRLSFDICRFVAFDFIAAHNQERERKKSTYFFSKLNQKTIEWGDIKKEEEMIEKEKTKNEEIFNGA